MSYGGLPSLVRCLRWRRARSAPPALQYIVVKLGSHGGLKMRSSACNPEVFRCRRKKLRKKLGSLLTTHASDDLHRSREVSWRRIYQPNVSASAMRIGHSENKPRYRQVHHRTETHDARLECRIQRQAIVSRKTIVSLEYLMKQIHFRMIQMIRNHGFMRASLKLVSHA